MEKTPKATAQSDALNQALYDVWSPQHDANPQVTQQTQKYYTTYPVYTLT